MIEHEQTPDAPTITLAGREWAVPRLAPRQNRVVVPALLELVPKILRARDDAGADNFAQLARYLDTKTYDCLTELVYTALTRGAPDLTRAEFDDLPIDTLEMIASVRTIADQAGMIQRSNR